MENIIVFGFAYEGWLCYQKLCTYKEFNMLGFADNSLDKQGNIAFGYPIRSMEELDILNKQKNISIVIASNYWAEIGIELEKKNIPIKGIWGSGQLKTYISPMTFERLDFSEEIKFYAGDICDDIHFLDKNLYGLSINRWDNKHIKHDITKVYPLPANCIDSFEAEDVFEHIDNNTIPNVLKEIFRILKKGGRLRICVPDFWDPVCINGTMKDKNGKILWDPSGGGKYGKNGVELGGHLWFPTYEIMNKLLKSTEFEKVEFLCYHTEKGNLVMKDIDFTKGHVNRIQDSIMGVHSIVIDCYK